MCGDNSIEKQVWNGVETDLRLPLIITLPIRTRTARILVPDTKERMHTVIALALRQRLKT